MANINSLLSDILDGNGLYVEALSIIRKNSYGNIWLIGGFVYRNLASELYGTAQPQCDIDFIVEDLKSTLELPSGWSLAKTSLGGMRLKNNARQIDVVGLAEVHTIVRRNLPPAIEYYLDGTPLTIGSIAYDIQQGKVIGDVGIAALYDKTVAPYDLEELEQYVQLKGMTKEEFVCAKAASLGFTPDYIKR